MLTADHDRLRTQTRTHDVAKTLICVPCTLSIDQATQPEVEPSIDQGFPFRNYFDLS